MASASAAAAAVGGGLEERSMVMVPQCTFDTASCHFLCNKKRKVDDDTSFATSKQIENESSENEEDQRPGSATTMAFDERLSTLQQLLPQGLEPRRGKRKHDGSVYKWAWKGRVVEFRIPQGKTTVKEVLVQHVYMHHQLVMAPGYETGLPLHRPNYIYPSSYEEWQPIQCIVGVIHVLHGHVGQLQYEDRTGGSLADEGLFFYDHFYQLQGRCNTKGYLQAVPLEIQKNILAWSVPDCFGIESTRSKLYRDVQRSLRATIPTKLVRIMLSMPMNSFVEMFGEFDVRVMKTMLACRRMDQELLAKLMWNQWFMRQVGNVYCRIVLDIVVAKYMILTQSFTLSFWYCREHYISRVLVPMDQEADSLEDNQVVDIEVVDETSSLLTIISIREECTLAELRTDMNVEAPNLLPQEFYFIHNRKRVLKRRESHMKCRELQGRVQAKA